MEDLMATTESLQSRQEDGTSSPALSHDKRWWILAVLGVAQLMVILDTTIVNIALPTAQHGEDPPPLVVTECWAGRPILLA
jgi:hypothetical protein